MCPIIRSSTPSSLEKMACSEQIRDPQWPFLCWEEEFCLFRNTEHLCSFMVAQDWTHARDHSTTLLSTLSWLTLPNHWGKWHSKCLWPTEAHKSMISLWESSLPFSNSVWKNVWHSTNISSQWSLLSKQWLIWRMLNNSLQVCFVNVLGRVSTFIGIFSSFAFFFLKRQSNVFAELILKIILSSNLVLSVCLSRGLWSFAHDDKGLGLNWVTT